MSQSAVPSQQSASPVPAAGSGGTRKPRVAVVFGGRSGEHTISCATAAGVLSAMDRDRFDVVPVGITPAGQWVLVDDDPGALALSDDRPPVEITAEGPDEPNDAAGEDPSSTMSTP